MAFQVLVESTGPSNSGAPIYQGNANVPQYGAGGAIPGTALTNYPPGTTYRRFVQTIGATGPITNANLVVDIIQPGGQTEPGAGGVNATALCIVYTVAGGVLT